MTLALADNSFTSCVGASCMPKRSREQSRPYRARSCRRGIPADEVAARGGDEPRLATMTHAVLPPGHLVDGQHRPRAARLAGGTDWYLAAAGRFELVGSGDVSAADLASVHDDLGWAGVFVCVAKPAGLESRLAAPGLGTNRITASSRRGAPTRPKVAWVASGARLAVLPDVGSVWVDSEHLFHSGEIVPLPWTDPVVTLLVTRPGTIRRAIRAALGKEGPRRAKVPSWD